MSHWVSVLRRRPLVSAVWLDRGRGVRSAPDGAFALNFGESQAWTEEQITGRALVLGSYLAMPGLGFPG